MTQTCFQKGFGLSGEVRPVLAETDHSSQVARLKAFADLMAAAPVLAVAS